MFFDNWLSGAISVKEGNLSSTILFMQIKNTFTILFISLSSNSDSEKSLHYVFKIVNET